MADELAATLAALKAHYPPDAGYERPRRLVLAIEALLTQARRWTDEAAALDKRAEASEDPPAYIQMYARAQALSDCAGELREVIEMNLLGEDGTDGK